MDDSNHSSIKVGEKTEARRGFFGKRRQNGKDSNSAVKQSTLDPTTEDEEDEKERPAFQSALHGQSSSSKKMQPRAVAIPYSRLNKERFYDWPPDPTVSRATPIALYPETIEDDDSLTASVPDVTMPEHEEHPSTLRRRPNATDSDHHPDIPTNITFTS